MIKKIQNEMVCELLKLFFDLKVIIIDTFFQGDIVTKEIVLGNVKVRNVIVNLGNKFIQSIKEDCGGNVSLKLPTVKGDNVSIFIFY